MAGLNRDLLRLNNILRMKRGQESAVAAESQHVRIPASSLPQWLKLGAKCCYMSKTTGGMHTVKVQKIDERQQMVTVVFEQDKKNGKKVPFAECSKMGDGTLRPVWKASTQQVVAAAPTAAQAPAPANVEGAPLLVPNQPVEDIVSSGDESKATDTPRQLLFLPRAVALGGKKVAVAVGPAPWPGGAVADTHREAPSVTATPAEISDDEELCQPQHNDSEAGAVRSVSRSPRRVAA
mmetsp:Transcript_82160/g.190787  ORF Transcript_82160/g.190787 Transcript_82160/m.190787 type:complete len:236 (+) Transcript_82160:76-783(+)|eukprot:CAMPEP_0171095294 /NCGR_PEP_ID=MMETSP0766_2-20121228/43092_1 /TAXON_ID=439317 /ORGANISM="Gambierdiscus australes, Strain CAWD 149" /LENGTH=235 /DNA_ID=CAMNT_0011554085 /DNA_START=76 /DNA_END=783 /DNA_ORIENTATION=-